MQNQRQFVAMLLLAFLLIAIPLGRDRGIKAEPPLPENSEKTIGEAVNFTITEEKANPVVVEANRFTFLPLVLGIEGTEPTTEADEVVVLVNAERARVGCAPLQVSSQLRAAAQKHTEDMAINDYFSHTSLDGHSPWDRIRAEGYNFWSAAENIAAGYTSPASVMDAWMNSDGHRANILNCGLEDIGVGYYYLANDTGNLNYRHYWTQDFGSRK